MRSRLLLALALLPSAVRAEPPSWAAQALSAAPTLRFARPSPAPAQAAAAPVAVLREAIRARLARNPVAARFALPMLDGVELAVRSEAEDPGLKDAVAYYKRDRKLLVLNRDAIDEALPAQASANAVADRFLPVIAHELGGHARHYAELARLLGHPAPNVRETETNALWLEAMTTAAERRLNPSYLRDESAYSQGESRLVDQYWLAKRKNDPSPFRAYVAAIPAYGKLPAATGETAAYYDREERSLWAADRALVGADAPEDERDAGRPERPDAGMRPSRR
jgi:hypothetical protein